MYSQQITAWGEPLQGNESATPEPTGTQVLMKVTGCGVCHSDIHIWDGYFDMGGGQKVTLESRGLGLPFTMGHEVVGEVVALGPAAEGVAIGDRRVVYPWIGCGGCDDCKRGDELLCLAPRTVGTRYAGGYADHCIVHHPRYLIDFEGIPAELACTYACSGVTAYSALKKAAAVLRPQDTLLIIGAGGVGLNGVYMAASVVPSRIVVADIDADKRAAAAAAPGIDAVIDNAEADALAKLQAMTGGGPQAAIDFVGAPQTSGYGLQALRRGGTHIVVGLYGGALPLPLAGMPLRMLNIRGSYVGSLSEMHELMGLVKAGKVKPIPITTKPLDEATGALNSLKQGNVVGRVVLQP